jgi:hypothetical protein
MLTKLTLSIDKTVIERSKAYAKETGRSLSKIVEAYLNSITSTENIGTENMSTKFEKLYGAVDIPLDFDHKSEIRKIMEQQEK